MSEWQPIETVPMHQRILLFYPPQRSHSAGIHICDDWNDIWLTRTWFKPTHWMPLPQAPGADSLPIAVDPHAEVPGKRSDARKEETP